VINKSFWSRKKVLITGHTGFKGSWLSIWLQHMGAEVIGVSLDPPTNPNLFTVANVCEGIIDIRENVANTAKIKRIFLKYKPDVVFHLAAQSIVRYSYKNPVETYKTNVMGTLNILEGIRSIDTVRSAVMVTTDKCYENKDLIWGYRENDPMGGHDPYSSSKGSAELLIASYRRSYYPTDEHNKHKTAIASVRAGNVIGGGDWAEDRLVPDIIRAFQKDNQVQIRNPNSIRPWQYVLEPLYGYIKLAEQLSRDSDGYKYAEAWNFGPKDEDIKTVEWIVKRLAKQWGGNANWLIDGKGHPHEASYLKLDCSKANLILNWSSKCSIDYTLSKVVEWHKIDNKGNNYREVCLQQINEYMDFYKK